MKAAFTGRHRALVAACLTLLACSDATAQFQAQSPHPVRVADDRAAQSARAVGTQRFVYRAEGKRLADVLRDFAASQGLPAVVGDGVEGVVSANFDTTPQGFLNAISKAYGVLWYHDGTALYFYPPSAIQSRLFRLKGYSREEVMGLLASLGLGDKRFELRFDDAQHTLLVYGPPRHIELVAQALESLDQGATEGNERVVRVFPLRFASAGDRALGEVNIPGIASVLRGLYSRNSAESEAGESQGSRPVSLKIRSMESLYGSGKMMPDLPSVSHESMPAPDKSGAARSTRSLRSPVNFEEDQPNFEADEGTNSVIVQGRSHRMREYEALIQRLDQKPMLVELEVMIIDVSEDNVHSLGVDWSLQGSKGQFSVTSPAGAAGPAGSGQTISGLGTFSIGTVVADAGRQLLMRINALQGEGKARVLSKPSLLGVVNRPAMMKEKRVATVRVAGNLDARLFQIEAGTLMQVTPQVIEDEGGNQIKLSLYIEDGNFETSLVDQVPVVRKTEIRTEAHVREGESLLIGGLMVESTTVQESGVPGLRRAPLVGGLFRWNGSSTSRTERLFLITPKVVGGRTVTTQASTTQASKPATDSSRLKLSLSLRPGGVPAAAQTQGESAAQSHEREAQSVQHNNGY
ncbi:type III secretion protein C [Hydrogenophaga palleronii]|uniref:Type 3 secretion system secretin n=1 Tax=Hydrogenophaga palleronii TaxID=65655 RepID=A0ABU1WKY8_9BURK|nr:type III secretion system outer membrane ring subunit SctC [Hydrogenophaga palleronii]MDR7149967.1 type III secretion protein C [Hydrogenophaga palleronii]